MCKNFHFSPFPIHDKIETFRGEHDGKNLVNALKYKIWKINEGKELYLLEGLQTGDPVIIQDGTFAGYEAIFDTNLNGSERVRVLLQFLGGRKVHVELPTSSIERKRKK